MSLFSKYQTAFQKKEQVELSMEDFVKLVKKDKMVSATAAERMLAAIGEPELFDSSTSPRTARIFGNKILRRYKAFETIYGLEEIVEKIVGFFRHSAQGLEESRQILCLHGPVGSAKSTIVELLKDLMETYPIYILKAGDTLSPIFESPLGLFSPDDAKELGVPASRLMLPPSPWALKRLKEFEGDLTKFTVVKTYPSKYYQIANVKVEAGDPNTQDISVLTGKTDIRKIGKLSQDDPDAYSFSGGLCKANQGMLDFVEMLKADNKVLLPLLTATQEHNYTGTESIGPIPFDGAIVAHFNDDDLVKFKKDKKNQATLDRLCIIDVPYNLRKTEEIKILKKLINSSTLKDAPCAPYTYECLAEFTVQSKLSPPENSTLLAKLQVYDGESIKDKDPSAKSLLEYKKDADPQEGFVGISTRSAYKLLAEAFNYDTKEIAADPVGLFIVLNNFIDTEVKATYGKEACDSFKEYLHSTLQTHYAKLVGNDIQYGYLEYYDDYRQNYFEQYIAKADAWLSDNDFKDIETGHLLDRKMLNDELSILEKSAKIANPKDFRSEVVHWVLRQRANKGGVTPRWDAYAKIKKAIDDSLAKKLEDILPVISFSGQASAEDKQKHNRFVERMKEKGYTEKQLQRIVKWFIDFNKAVQ